jgi:hypothetical protein
VPERPTADELRADFAGCLARDRRNTLLAFFELRADGWLDDGHTEACRVMSLWRYRPEGEVPHLDGDHDPAEIANGNARGIAEVLVAALEAGDLNMGWDGDVDIVAEFVERFGDDG